MKRTLLLFPLVWNVCLGKDEDRARISVETLSRERPVNRIYLLNRFFRELSPYENQNQDFAQQIRGYWRTFWIPEATFEGDLIRVPYRLLNHETFGGQDSEETNGQQEPHQRIMLTYSISAGHIIAHSSTYDYTPTT